MKAEKRYKELHSYRMHLRCAGMLTDKENENIKKKIESFGKKNGIAIVSEYIATLKTVDKIRAKTINKPI